MVRGKANGPRVPRCSASFIFAAGVRSSAADVPTLGEMSAIREGAASRESLWPPTRLPGTARRDRVPDPG